MVIGMVVGTLCVVAILRAVHLGRRWRWAHACAHAGCGPEDVPWGGPFAGRGFRHGFGRWGGGFGRWHGGFGDGFLLRRLFARLETTPGQERVIRAAVERVRETAREARAEWRDTGEISSLLRGETFDRTAAEGLSGKADASFAKLRVVVVEALAQIHEVLDDHQRRILAELVESRGGTFRGWRGGPYRGAGHWV